MFACKLLSCLTKVFSDEEPVEEHLPLSILKGETASMQVAVRADCMVQVKASAPGFRTRVREVVQVPVRRPCTANLEDAHYLRKTPGLYPDLLQEMPEDGTVRVGGWWKAFWIDAQPEDGLPTGAYPLTISVTQMGEDGETFTAQQEVFFTGCPLPEQKLIHTQWLHCDCLADFYHVKVFSEEHWKIVENFVSAAVQMGINMILTPLFTPPLDTQVGGERTTVQLVDVFVQQGQYAFSFERLERWVRMCKRCGVRYFELSHLYSQWGTNRAPKIMATVDGTYQQIFGWDQVATDPQYGNFLRAFLPQLVKKLKEVGIGNCSYFHIMDEPSDTMLQTYMAEKAQVSPYIEGMPIIDALSHFSLYKAGAVDCPVVCTNAQDMALFLQHRKNLWLYYCCEPEVGGANRFIAMPSARTRVLGIQLYLYQAGGFLHWGFNFYNAQLSREHINPFAVTDCGEAFPAGDAFIVYPGADGTPLASLRYQVFRQAIHDLRALELLESFIGREKVVQMIHDGLDYRISLMAFPYSNAYYMNLRKRVNAEIQRNLAEN